MRRALLLLGFVCTTLPVLADPPSENVLRPGGPSVGQFYVEPHLGINLTFLDGNPRLRAAIPGEGETDIYNSASGVAPLAGIVFGYAFTPSVAVELDLAYDGHTADNSGTTQDGCEIFTPGQPSTIIQVPTNKKYSVDVNYFSVGLSGSVSFDKLFVFGGPQVAVPLSSDVTETMEWADTAQRCQYFYGTDDSTRIVVNAFDSTTETATRASFRIGIGARFELSKGIELVPRVAYDLALSDTFIGDGFYALGKPETESANYLESTFNNAIRLSALQASLGLRILL
jgi:hypothetical protein